jgi:hypothetical protein
MSRCDPLTCVGIAGAVLFALLKAVISSATQLMWSKRQREMHPLCDSIKNMRSSNFVFLPAFSKLTGVGARCVSWAIECFIGGAVCNTLLYQPRPCVNASIRGRHKGLYQGVEAFIRAARKQGLHHRPASSANLSL